MDGNSDYNPQIGSTEEDPYASDIQATIDWNINGDEMPQVLTTANDRHSDMPMERILSLSAVQAGLHGEHLSPSLTIQPDGFISSSVFASDKLYNNRQPNAILYSSDRMCFYAHTSLLLSVSDNNFGNLIHNDTSASPHNPIILSIATSSDVLDISLRVIYVIAFPSTLPPFSTFENAVRFLKRHGMAPLSEWIGPASHMFIVLASFAPQHALELFVLGAEFDVEPIAADASSFLLEFPWSSISEGTAERIGGVYMRRLGNLQIGRMNALKRILLPGPSLHPVQDDECSEERQSNLTRSYALTAAYVCWNANADLSVSYIEKTFQQISNKLTCPTCKDGLDRRIKESIEAWTALKRTI